MIHPSNLSAVEQWNDVVTRRQFFRHNAMGLGTAALATLLGKGSLAANDLPAGTHFPPKAKRAIYISLIGAPSQLDLFDYKPNLKAAFKKELKDYLAAQGERLTGMTAGQASFPVAPYVFKFTQHGQAGTWFRFTLGLQHVATNPSDTD